MEISLKELNNIITSNTNNHINELCLDGIINSVSIDSRKVEKGSLFVPFIGEFVNGYDFIEDAFKNGASAVLWESKHPNPPIDLGPIFFVEDNQKAIQDLARYYLTKLNCKTIGITGSNGKTSTKDILSSICETTFVTYKTNGNYNNHLGLPLTILSAPRNTEVLILEMGMSGFGEISLLSSIAKPDYAIITNIGESHIEHLGSREGIAKAKFEIVEYLSPNGKLIFDGDEPLLLDLVNSHNTPAMSIGFEDFNDLLINVLEKDLEQRFSLSGVFNLNTKTNLLGDHQIKNCSLAIAIAKLLGVSDEKITFALNNTNLTPMRMELIEKSNKTIINDCYNASPTSMKAAITFINNCKTDSKKAIVIGDMLELGENSVKYHIELYSHLQAADIEQFVFIGEHCWHLYNLFNSYNTTTGNELKIFYFSDVEDAIKKRNNLNFTSHLVLLKGSRGMKLERLLEVL